MSFSVSIRLNAQDYSVLYNNISLPVIYEGWLLLTCAKHLHDRIDSLSRLSPQN